MRELWEDFPFTEVRLLEVIIDEFKTNLSQKLSKINDIRLLSVNYMSDLSCFC